jgi:hypothetical protein
MRTTRVEWSGQRAPELESKIMKIVKKLNVLGWMTGEHDAAFRGLATKDPVKSLHNLGHLVRLQGFAPVSSRLRASHGWQGNQPFRV